MAIADLGSDIKALYHRAAPDACNTWADYVSICKSISPGFVNLPSTDQVACLCYDKYWNWYPEIFDDAVDSCAAWAATADVADFTIVDSWEGICTDVGNIFSARATPASSPVLKTPTPTPTPAPTPSPTKPTTVVAPITTPAPNGGCSNFNAIISSCTAATPGILDMTFGAIAACVCYTSSTSWIPGRFDSAVASCANVYKTADPTDYPIITSILDLCTLVGDVVNTPDSGLMTPPVTSTTQSRKVTPTTVQNPVGITPKPTTVVLGSSPSPSISTRSSNALRLLAYGGSMKALGSAWIIVTLALALL